MHREDVVIATVVVSEFSCRSCHLKFTDGQLLHMALNAKAVMLLVIITLPAGMSKPSDVTVSEEHAPPAGCLAVGSALCFKGSLIRFFIQTIEECSQRV